MRRKKGFVLREICGQNVILGEGLDAVDFGNLITLNDTASFLFSEAEHQGEFSAQSLAQALCLEYDIDFPTALNDTQEILSSWIKYGIVEK
ncbi:MAG: PqqD family protein [Bacteroidales bacterium]|nr:PqqD family protein [Bacteroidales bacterium]